MPHSEYWPFRCPTSIAEYEETDETAGASVLQKQIGDMEGEVKQMQQELAAIRKERSTLIPRRNNLDLSEENHGTKNDEKSAKYSEVGKLREDLIRAKNAADEERFKREKYENKLHDLEAKLNGLCGLEVIKVKDDKEIKSYHETEVVSLKKEVRDLKDQLEEAKLTLNDKTDEVQEYRLKYLQAQQQVEELRRQLEVVDYDNKQVAEQVQMEIQKMKMQFQEKLHELAPLPDLLKGAQIELQEAKQLQRLAEDSSSQFSNELQRVKEKLVIAVNCVNKEKAARLELLEENKELKSILNERQTELDQLQVTLEDYKCSILRLQEKLKQQEDRFKEKSLECAELLKDLDELRHESSRSISRTKERADSTRRYLQMQISEMERQLVQSRAQCRSIQKDRDEIRQRMTIQINNLQESFEMVEIRLRALQGQMSALKSSYAAILTGDEESNDFKN